MDPSVVIAMVALIVAAGYIIYIHHQLDEAEEACGEAEEALENADRAVTIYQQVLTDVAYGNAILEVSPNGQIVATKLADREAPLH